MDREETSQSPGEGSYLGYQPGSLKKRSKRLKEEDLYIFFMFYRVNNVILSLLNILLSTAQLIDQVPFQGIEKVATREGVFIKGIKLNPFVINRYSMYGGPLLIQGTEPKQGNPDLYNTYLNLKTPLKTQ